MDEARRQELDQRWRLARDLLAAARTGSSAETWSWALCAAADLQTADLVPCGWGIAPPVSPDPIVRGQQALFETPQEGEEAS